MRIISSLLLVLIAYNISFGKAVDVQTAQKTAYGFCKSEGINATLDNLLLIYTATSSIDGASINDFYVFSTGANGFVMVSGDDNIIPVLAYSTESPFVVNNMPEHVSSWLHNYENQINYIITKGISAPAQTAKWNDLLQNRSIVAAARTTSAATPLLHTFWDQKPYYNALCPYDATADTNVLTGCVATAMAQVMKYWNWPVTGVGAHSYSSGYGELSANFAGTTYQWDSMKNSVTKVDTAIAVLMFQAGVSVDMSYGVTASGAFVNQDASPVTNCTEYALKNYFRYKVSTMRGLNHYAYDDTEWVHMLKAEIDLKRPVIYTGYGSAGGHCFVADGYTIQNKMHINWGWGGFANGYYTVENLGPGTETFNDNQTLLIGIEPDTVTDHTTDTVVVPVVNGIKQLNVSGTVNVYPNPATEVVNIDLRDTKATRVSLTDMQGRRVKTVTPTANPTIVTIPLSDLSAGMYFVQIQTAQGVQTRKIAVNR